MSLCSRISTTTPVPLNLVTTKSWWKKLQEKTIKKPSNSTTTANPVSTEVDLPEAKNVLVEKNSLEVVNDRCQDRITNIAGSMSCKAFLRSFAYQYCKHKYIRKNCCDSHKRYCSGSTHG